MTAGLAVPARILLVEDDSNAVLIAVRALCKAGFTGQIQTARDGVEALARLGLGSQPGLGSQLQPQPQPRLGARCEEVDLPSVIFLDLNMPRLDGWEVLRRIRADPRTRFIPVVVTSSSDRPEDIQRSYDLGANSFVVKTFDPCDPGSYVAAAAEYWIQWNRTTR